MLPSSPVTIPSFAPTTDGKRRELTVVAVASSRARSLARVGYTSFFCRCFYFSQALHKNKQKLVSRIGDLTAQAMAIAEDAKRVRAEKLAAEASNTCCFCMPVQWLMSCLQ